MSVEFTLTVTLDDDGTRALGTTAKTDGWNDSCSGNTVSELVKDALVAGLNDQGEGQISDMDISVQIEGWTDALEQAKAEAVSDYVVSINFPYGLSVTVSEVNSEEEAVDLVQSDPFSYIDSWDFVSNGEFEAERIES